MLSTRINPFLLDAGKRFARLVDGLGPACPGWGFCVTGDCPPEALALPARVRNLGFVDSPFAVLAESRAVALLSDYGFGFKTKILDAVRHGCYTLTTRKLYRRLPAEVRPYCVVVEDESAGAFARALEASLRPYPGGDPNAAFRRQAFAALDEVFCSQA
jgi:glycosyltransferase involved in cell wall biosynthesis